MEATPSQHTPLPTETSRTDPIRPLPITALLCATCPAGTQQSSRRHAFLCRPCCARHCHSAPLLARTITACHAEHCHAIMCRTTTRLTETCLPSRDSTILSSPC